jgi:NAD-dependent dihydropyrimidine dehydrogenase PreA subunit
MKSKRYAVVDENRCVACGACIKECPRDAIDIWKGCYAKIDAACCIGCGKCSVSCPADSIELHNREDRNE